MSTVKFTVKGIVLNFHCGSEDYMEPSEIFRNVLKKMLTSKPWGAQARLADEIGVSRTHLNDFLAGRKPLSEQNRVAIAEVLGFTYENFLSKGRGDESFASMGDSVSITHFWAALEFAFRHSGKVGSQKELASIAGVSNSVISEQLNKVKGCSRYAQEKIAAAFGYDLVDFLAIGRDCLVISKSGDADRLTQAIDQLKSGGKPVEKLAAEANRTDVVAIDPATRILHEALVETGVKVNKKQREALVRVLREDLGKMELQTKDRVMGMLKAMSGGGEGKG